MAAPQTHIAINLILWQILARVFNLTANFFTLLGLAINIDFWLSVFVFGTMSDFDHFLNVKYVKHRILGAISGADKHPEKYGDEYHSQAYLHSLPVLILSVTVSLVLKHPIPVILFIFHQMIDFLEKPKHPYGHDLWFFWPLPICRRRIHPPFSYTGKGIQEFILTATALSLYALWVTGC